RAIDYFDLVREFGSLRTAFQAVQARFLLISFSSDWLYPTYQSHEITAALRDLKKDVKHVEVESAYGHDAFLLEEEVQTPIIAEFLAKTHAAIADRGSRIEDRS